MRNLKQIAFLFFFLVCTTTVVFTSCSKDDTEDSVTDITNEASTNITNAVSITSITLNKSASSLMIGGKDTLTASIAPANAPDKTITWTTSDASKATVSNGVVTTVATGTATITAKAGDKTATCLVTITADVSSSVLINGVRWAISNVASAGKFAPSAESTGCYYQWNSNVAWSVTASLSDWNNVWKGGYITPSASDTWTKVNDPSPAGYRVPTKAEFESLLNTTYVTNTWTIQNGVYGRKFTDKASGNSIFIPAVGYRRYNGGFIAYTGSGAYYWSSTVCWDTFFSQASSNGSPYYLDFGNSEAYTYYANRACGYTIRSVVE